LTASDCSTCIDGYYRDTTAASVCIACPSPCYTCSVLNPSTCLSCNNGNFLDETSCISLCPSGEYAIESSWSCNSCGSNCESCFSSANNACLSCISGTYFLNNTCISFCPATYYLYSSTCYLICPINTYAVDINYTCQSCQSNCEQCVSELYCDECSSAYNL
jgi:hypothetical protein